MLHRLRSIAPPALALFLLMSPLAQAKDNLPPTGCAAADNAFRALQAESLKSLSAYKACISQHFARRRCRAEFAVVTQDQARLEAAVAQVADRCGQ